MAYGGTRDWLICARHKRSRGGREVRLLARGRASRAERRFRQRWDFGAFGRRAQPPFCPV